MDYSSLAISEKQQFLFAESVYACRDDTHANINADFLKLNSQYFQESIRELFSSLLQMLPLLERTVPLEDADYILYSHRYASISDESSVVLEQLHYIDEHRRPEAEIIVVGPAFNVEALLAGSMQNITFWPDHYAELAGKKFKMDITDEYLVYDSKCDVLYILPVNGCLRKCKFCRMCYMSLPFESVSLEYIEAKLNWYRDNCPEKLHNIRLWAENLTEYGIDFGDGTSLADLINLISSYNDVKSIQILFGLAICEITDRILDSLCSSGKMTYIAINPEAGSNRQLKIIGKDHTRERAIYIATKLKEAYPDIYLSGTVMIGLPDETLNDVYDLANLCIEMALNAVQILMYSSSPKLPLNSLPQLSIQLAEYHRELLVKLIKRQRATSMQDDFMFIEYWKKSKRRIDIFDPSLKRFFKCPEELERYCYDIRQGYIEEKRFMANQD